MTESDHDLASTLRIIDANANRVLEGLRVVEDHLRFHHEDAHLCRRCKAIRHQVSETLAKHFAERTSCRSTESDVGTTIGTNSEYQRQDVGQLVAANFGRAKEALRTLEEFSKRIAEQPAREFEALRYQTYTLEKAVGHLTQSPARLSRARLYVLVDLRFGIDEPFIRRIEALNLAGTDVIQLRDKNATDRELIEAGRRLRSVLSGSFDNSNTKGDSTDCALLIMNDRPDLARVVRADGVHVGQEEMPVAEVRSIVGPSFLIGVSTHSLEQAQEAVLDGADYIGVGPVFPSQTKDFDAFVGTELVASVHDDIALPSFAIGGITLERLPEILDRGAKRIAVSEAIWGASDVAAAARQFCSILKS